MPDKIKIRAFPGDGVIRLNVTPDELRGIADLLEADGWLVSRATEDLTPEATNPIQMVMFAAEPLSDIRRFEPGKRAHG